MKTIIILISMMNIFLLTMYSSPLSILINILAQTSMMCMLMWLITNTSWITFLIFLIYLGGLMVLFIYIVSLSPNEKLNTQMKLNNLNYWFLMIPAILIINMNEQNIPFTKMNFIMNFNQMFYLMNLSLSTFSMLYLLFCLIVVVKMCSKTKGPLKINKT